ncbi:ATP-binding protein [Palleronia pelagia]|uniref:histidine kinase n=1 Tax=Palleronia pelagia TaxID=387096 RepID=A0A1H8H9E3_9RHOB|nr:ATP-binding protein [Palleronia pelagia]SEN52806.1 PAS/PAC sensor hybrid histidine kinase [Palleronia pelagia]
MQPIQPFQIARIAFGLLTFAILVLTLGALTMNVLRDLRDQRSAQEDIVQWSLSQVEIDFLRLQLAVSTLPTDQPGTEDLDQVTRAFDIFYSRVDLLRNGSAYAALRDLAEFDQAMSRVETFLDDTVPLIDGPSQDLVGAAPALLTRIETLRPAVRQVSRSGVGYFARLSDDRRNEVVRTLVQLAAVAGGLLLALLLLALRLGWLNAQSIRRRAEVAAAYERVRVVSETSLDAVILSDETGKVLSFNAAAERTFGVFAAQAIGKNLSEVIVPEHLQDWHQEEMRTFERTGKHAILGKGRVKGVASRADGTVFPVELSVQRATTLEGDIYVVVLRDISHRVQAERDLVAARDQALASERAKGDFLATMSHEIRTPLNGLLGNLGLLGDTILSERQQEYVRNMETSGRMLLRHVTDVLDITRYDAGKLRLRQRPMHVGRMIQDIVDNQSGAARANDTRLSWAWEGDRIDWILADRDRIEGVLLNIVGNAVKFTHGGQIDITAKVEPGTEPPGDDRPVLHVAVRDTGMGIAEDMQARIFEDFTTGDTTYDRQAGGTGLGLGLARRFAEAMGGAITLDSAPGRGSTFCLRLPVDPVDPPHHPTPLPADRPAAPARPSRVLLVEDNVINRTIARETLSRAAHEVTEAKDGTEAVRLAARSRFDVILMDVRMPKMDGRKATRLIRGGDGASKDVPIIALTANAQAEEQAAFLADGMNDVMVKPVLGDALLCVVDRWTSGDGASAPDPVDAEPLADLRQALGPDRVDDLLGRFAREVDTLISNGPDADPAVIADEAHRSAGSAAMFGATALQGALGALEQAARNEAQDGEFLAAAHNAARAEWSRSRVALGL